jgi:hypothetical protein
MSMQIKSWSVVLMTAVLVLAGCSGESASYDKPAEAEPAEATEVAQPASFELTPELEAKLASADRADGDEDHVVAQCPGCGLAMEGEVDHVFEVGDYALHFCSDSCQGEFSEDLRASLIALVVPGVDGVEEDTEEEPQQ